MKPVNLLPPSDRPLKRVEQGNGSYLVLGVLGALLIAVLAVVLTQNQINSRTDEIARAKQEQQQAEQKAARLGPFGQFATIKQTRLASVTDLADARFDWERLMRELARVLPEGTWVTEASTSTDGVGGEGAAAPIDVAAPAGPSLKLIGCAPSQTAVAKVMVRLRSLHRAQDVELSESAKPEEAVQADPNVTATEPTGAASGCGNDYQFDTTVSFSAAAEVDTEPKPDGGVPASLGGGS